MLRGHLDNVTSRGYIEGWAFDTDEPSKTLEVSVVLEDAEIAWGLAHRFRADLMAASYGLGWCAFRLRSSVSIAAVRTAPLRLAVRRTGQQICVVTGISLIQEPDLPVPAAGDPKLSDPTVISGVWQLKQYEQLFMTFISQHGVETFLSVAYAYMLGRPVDQAGLTQYTRCIRQTTLTPIGVLEALEKCDEFRVRKRAPAAPNSDSFPFTLNSLG
jgi:hypothetical protein